MHMSSQDKVLREAHLTREEAIAARKRPKQESLRWRNTDASDKVAQELPDEETPTASKLRMLVLGAVKLSFGAALGMEFQ